MSGDVDAALARVREFIDFGRRGWAEPELLAALEVVYARAAIRAESGLDVERLARAVLDTPAAFPGSDLCRFCQNIEGHSFDCVIVVARKYARLATEGSER